MDKNTNWGFPPNVRTISFDNYDDNFCGTSSWVDGRHLILLRHWNSLPAELRLSTLSTATFARRLKAHLFVSTEWNVPAARLILLKAALLINIIIIIIISSSGNLLDKAGNQKCFYTAQTSRCHGLGGYDFRLLHCWLVYLVAKWCSTSTCLLGDLDCFVVHWMAGGEASLTLLFWSSVVPLCLLLVTFFNMPHGDWELHEVKSAILSWLVRSYKRLLCLYTSGYSIKLLWLSAEQPGCLPRMQTH